MKVYFPYDRVRAEQQEFVRDTASIIKEKKIFLAHAPTGLGKTVSTLAPALSYAIMNNKKVFFLTPKISQHEIVLETSKLMNEKFGLSIKAIDLVGRRQMCIDPFLSNTQYAIGFYEACNKKKKDKLCKYYTNTKGYTPKQKAEAIRNKRGLINSYNHNYSFIKEQCELHELCPYELTLEMIKNADLIIGDYTHIFHEDIREGILNANNANIKLEDVILVVDEAHNLPERMRDMLSTRMDYSMIEKAQKEAKNIGDFEVEEIVKEFGKELLNLGKKISIEKSEARLEEKDIMFFKKTSGENLMKIEEASEKFMAKHKTENSYLSSIIEFIYILLKQKQHTLYLLERKGSLTIGVYPLEIMDNSIEVLSKVHSCIMMSGTLLPLEMYADVLGITKIKKNNIHNKLGEVFSLKEYKSPFSKENRLNLVVESSTTKYTSRNSDQFKTIAESIDKIVSKISGNTIVFFPSFELMNAISQLIKTRRQVLKQEREMSQDQKTKLIHNFKNLGSGFGGVLLAVSGGSIAEGIDFPGDNLSCAIIVGVPFAKMNSYTNALINYHQFKFNKGWEYAYNAPAISKAIQASGRVIRTETDKGVCVFLDLRFGEERFKQYYPKDFEYKKTLQPEKEVEEFFKG
ncbi:MAG: ATP-dependent DNA helicase [Candidatus ainarchaeum sp.]|jgi:DNA excision repair protein ERCC-2|nr:ATP-dependent DNA helicase [Candidatus ainarchaeum sp.]MDD3086279.1 ATP-dependent DNA helicase [Candidatus ainarchaeum sp.]MDD4128859.1 ATP-dependent DNA helicase [Candidatus ainarchaeum sp.]